MKIINRCQASTDKVSATGEYQAIADKTKVNSRIRFCL
jgi:hypothetical protein